MLNYIEKSFRKHKANIIGKYEKNSVMILLKEENREVYVCFEVRSLNLRHQPGDVCFPGGSIEPGESPLEAAMRETCEELNINKDEIEYIGDMDYFVSPYNTIIYSFVGKLNNSNITPNSSEVDHVFWVPLKYFLKEKPVCFQIKFKPDLGEDFPFKSILGGKEYKFRDGKMEQYFYTYNGYTIWGLTARLVKAFVDNLDKDCVNSYEDFS